MPQSSHGNNRRGSAMALVAVLAALGLLFWLVMHIHNGVLYENCHMAGFRNCTGERPVITAPHRRDRLE